MNNQSAAFMVRSNADSHREGISNDQCIAFIPSQVQFWEVAAFLLAWPLQWVRTKITTFMSAEAGKEKKNPQITFLLPSKLYSYHPFTLSTGRWEDCFLILKYHPCGSLILLFLFKQLNPYSNYGTKTLLKLETQPALLSRFPSGYYHSQASSAIPTHTQPSLVAITRSWSPLLCGILHGPCSEHWALEKPHMVGIME